VHRIAVLREIDPNVDGLLTLLVGEIKAMHSSRDERIVEVVADPKPQDIGFGIPDELGCTS
jgi:hypothetical protein